ncbi:MAG: cell division protein FtsB [Pseudomonadota bacterium]|jgi:cell division protein FtsB|nr:cell division protein FtsB [Pseudomonadota bacterium]|tara:strand:+ start:794 stop:1090 length:297 start_codon:yes stop_codon:yes gene_type:complete
MKFITVIMVLLLLLLQYRLWTGNGSLIEVSLLREEIEKVKSENESLKERNLSLTAEVFNLKQGHEAIEEIARSEMGMVKDGETFYQIIDSAEQQFNSN